MTPYKQRLKIADRLMAEGRADLANRLYNCQEEFRLLCIGCGNPREVHKSCGLRWCPECARALAADRVATYQSAIDAMAWPMMVTLTMPHTLASSCPSDVRHLRRSLGRLRRLRWFKNKVKGGISSIEVTCGQNGWHPHAHLLIDCRWLSVQSPAPGHAVSAKELKRLCKIAREEVGDQWRLCLREDQRVQVSISRARPEAAREALKYAVKAAELADTPLSLAPLLDILRVTRLISAWGSVRRYRLEEAERVGEEPVHTVECACGCHDWEPDFVRAKSAGWRIERDRRRARSWPQPGGTTVDFAPPY